MKPSRILIVSMFLILCALSTVQAIKLPDYLIYKGKKYALYSNPLEMYFQLNPSKRPKGAGISAGGERNYMATFEIRDVDMYLKRIDLAGKEEMDSETAKEWKNTIQDIFAEDFSMCIDWYTGVIVLPSGKLINSGNNGDEGEFRQYLLLEVYRGKLVKELQFNRRQYKRFKKEQLELFKKTEGYQACVQKIEQKGYGNYESVDAYLEQNITKYTAGIIE